jgi:hypothetical protein
MGYNGTYDRTIYHDPVSGYCVITVKTADARTASPIRTRGGRSKEATGYCIWKA